MLHISPKIHRKRDHEPLKTKPGINVKMENPFDEIVPKPVL